MLVTSLDGAGVADDPLEGIITPEIYPKWREVERNETARLATCLRGTCGCGRLSIRREYSQDDVVC